MQNDNRKYAQAVLNVPDWIIFFYNVIAHGFNRGTMMIGYFTSTILMVSKLISVEMVADAGICRALGYASAALAASVSPDIYRDNLAEAKAFFIGESVITVFAKAFPKAHIPNCALSSSS
ncbi:MAG: hypothetical protein HOP08_19350 [Cyclobacteriaceae bacterium]|nr:hypothetical protein [Cyclobacteriaceae bacterium]